MARKTEPRTENIRTSEAHSGCRRIAAHSSVASRLREGERWSIMVEMHHMVFSLTPCTIPFTASPVITHYQAVSACSAAVEGPVE